MKKYICEFVGTFALVLIACGVAVVTNADVVATSLAFGLVIVAMAYSIGNVSGCHINPAVSLAMFVTGKIELKDFGFYVLAQVLGAIGGAFMLGILLGNFSSLGANSYGASGQMASTIWTAFLIEILLTFVFVLVILAVTSKKEYASISGIIIGLTLTLVHLIGIPFTGTSVNPARSIGPALFQGGYALAQIWVFILAPLIGAFLAAWFYEGILKPEKKTRTKS